MSRVAGIANSIRNSGVKLGPVDAVFAGLDYYDGKQQGEDDVRAIAGAAGSTVGGWGGAIAGGAAGAAVGSVVPVVGTAVGGAIGAIAGGMGGGFLGGWGADRTDELIRGNKGDNKMPYDQYGRRIPENQEGFGFDDAANLAAVGGVGAAGYQFARGAMRPGAIANPNTVYQGSRNFGLTKNQAVGNTVRNLADDGLRVMKNMPGWAKAAGIIGGGILANNAVGNPVGTVFGGTVDAITGGRTNWDNNPQDAAVMAAQKRQRYEQTVGKAQSDARLEAMRNDEMQRFIDERNDKFRKERREDDDFQWNREREATKQHQRYQLSAQHGIELMNNWQQSARNVTSAMNTINNARLI